MDYLILGNDLLAWAIALGIAAAVYLLLHIAKRLIVRRLRAFTRATSTYLDDLAVGVLSATHPLFLLAMGLYAGSHWLDLSEKSATLLSRLAIAALLLQVARWGDVGVHGWLQHYRTRRSAEDAASTTSTAALGFVARTAIWVIIVLMILDNFGVNITTLVASLGIGGIAVALATQNILGDLFASLSIVLDKPFEIGDFIIVGDALGAVEYIGLKTTRLRGLGGEQIVFSNSDLLKSRIHNHKRMQSRRVAFILRVAYGATEAQLARIPQLVRSIVTARQDVDYERTHFFRYGEWSLDFEVVYHFKSPDYILHMDAQEAILLEIYRAFERERIQFAHPLSVIRVAEPGDPAGGWLPQAMRRPGKPADELRH